MGATAIDIAIACNYMQHFEWWGSVFTNLIYEVQHGDITIERLFTSGSAVPDNSKNRTVGTWVHEKREKLTDVNRNKLVGVGVNKDKLPDGFMNSPAEWVFWIDDDTVPPKGAVKRLLDLRREIVAGLYFLGGEPHNPLAYLRKEDGFYSPLYNYTPGILTEVDGVGMGCTLIHKSVYEKIMDAHEVFQRPNATLFPIPKKDVDQMREVGFAVDAPKVIGDCLVMPLSRPGEDDNRAWPFYSMEYCRTEDLHFGELCQNAGIKIFVDTTVTCEHWKSKAVTYETYRDHLEKRLARNEEIADS